MGLSPSQIEHFNTKGYLVVEDLLDGECLAAIRGEYEALMDKLYDGGGLALLQTGDRIRVDLNKFSVNLLIDDEALAERAKALAAQGGFPQPQSQTPWQQFFREKVEPFADGMVLKDAPDYQAIIRKRGLPRDNH